MADVEFKRVEGVEQLEKALNQLIYGEADKAVKQAMTDAAKVAVKDLKASMPKKMFKQLAKYKFKQGRKHKFVMIGLADKKKTLPQVGYPNTKGNNKTVWSIAYWLNYGTLNRRDNSHKFTQAIKQKSVNSRRGVRPQNFFDTAEPTVEQIYAKAFQDALKNRTKDFYKHE